MRRFALFNAFDEFWQVLVASICIGGPILLLARSLFVEYKIDQDCETT